MGATIAYGSLTTVTGGDVELVGTGEHCVLDGILVRPNATSTDCDIAVSTVGGTLLHTFTALNLTLADAHFFGVSCGPLGISSTDGLDIDVTFANGAGTMTYLYRTGLS